MDTPVRVSSLMRVRCIGAAPRYLGNKEGCMLSLSDGSNRLRISAGTARPNDAVTRALEGSCSVNDGGWEKVTTIIGIVYRNLKGERTSHVVDSRSSSGISSTGTSRACARSFSGAIQRQQEARRGLMIKHTHCNISPPPAYHSVRGCSNIKVFPYIWGRSPI
jgi:hypothetical protein